MNFTKMQGAGNDFILVETGDSKRNWSQVALAACHRHFGVGGDGLLLVMPSDIADVRMRLFNADGSEAEACGNGLRCLARYVADRGLADTAAKELSIETMAGVRRVRLHRAEGRLSRIQVSMGQPGFGAEDIPVVLDRTGTGQPGAKQMLTRNVTVDGEELSLNFVSMGNPHAIHFCQHPVADFPLSRVGPKVEHHQIFPNRTNFEVARVLSRQQIGARVWERGVGETLACGTGACAVAVAAQVQDYVDNRVDIKLPGGILDIEWDEVGEVFLGGPTEVVFTGKWANEV